MSEKLHSEAVEVMTACGASPQAIARELGIPLSVLQEDYRTELDLGLEVANAKVAKVFFDLAVSGDHPSLTAKWMELRASWTPSSRLTIQDDTDQDLAREKLLRLMNRTAPTPAPAPPLKAVK